MDGALRTVNQQIAELYRLLPSEFVAARNLLAKALRKQGKRDDAQQVSKLQKPALSCWALNRLWLRIPDQFEELLALGLQIRGSQDSLTRGEPFKHLLIRRARLVSSLAAGAAHETLEAGLKWTPEAERQVVTTLEALCARGRFPDEMPAGQLTHDLAPPGFEELLEGPPGDLLDLAAPPPPASREQGPQRSSLQREMEACRARLSAVSLERSRAEVEYNEAEKRLSQAEASATTLQQQLEAAQLTVRELVALQTAVLSRLTELRQLEEELQRELLRCTDELAEHS